MLKRKGPGRRMPGLYQLHKNGFVIYLQPLDFFIFNIYNKIIEEKKYQRMTQRNMQQLEYNTLYDDIWRTIVDRYHIY